MRRKLRRSKQGEITRLGKVLASALSRACRLESATPVIGGTPTNPAKERAYARFDKTIVFPNPRIAE
jgi:hypothetical protein